VINTAAADAVETVGLGKGKTYRMFVNSSPWQMVLCLAMYKVHVELADLHHGAHDDYNEMLIDALCKVDQKALDRENIFWSNMAEDMRTFW